jgi:beta-galactosidase
MPSTDQPVLKNLLFALFVAGRSSTGRPVGRQRMGCLRIEKLKMVSLNAERISASTIVIKANLSAIGKKDFWLKHRVIYTVSGDGQVKIDNNGDSSNPQLVVVRMGVRMFLNKSYQQFRYFDHGPMENYSDRKTGSDIGIYSSTVLQQLTPYEKPMECGNHEDVRWAKVANETGSGLKVTGDASVLQVSALPYSDEELVTTEYKIDLPESKTTILCIGYKTLIVGYNSCVPTPMPAYTVFAGPSKFTYTLVLTP